MRKFTLLGRLPAGDWVFGLVVIKHQPDVVLVVDRTGQNAPRMVIGDKLVEVK